MQRTWHGKGRRTTRGAAGMALVLALIGCGSDAVTPVDDIAPLVGDWEATALVVTNVDNPTVRPDLIELGATFDLNIQPSGQYTAILIVALQSSTEIGSIRVEGSEVTLQPTFPPGQAPTRGTFSLMGDELTLDGSTEFDFNLDGTPEPALAHFELVRK